MPEIGNNVRYIIKVERRIEGIGVDDNTQKTDSNNRPSLEGGAIKNLLQGGILIRTSHSFSKNLQMI